MTIPCARCSANNRPGRRFCGQCGAALPTACAACGFLNEPEERFCGGCGVACGAERPSPRPRSSEGELRQVVVLFADIAGYTTLSGRLAPEDTHRMLGRFFAGVDGIVARFGGTVDKHIGDNVMALFGAPVAHGNDAERAVRAAFAMHAEVEAIGAELGLPLRLSIGIASGEVVASRLGSEHHDEYTVIGSSVNLAARLQGYAAAGETVVDDVVHRPVAALVEAERLEGLALKGIERPVLAWRLLALGGGRVARRPLVGRQAELARLAGAVSAAAAGRGEAVLVRAEAGIGKSRLVAEATESAAEQGISVHRVSFVDFGGASRQVAALLEGLEDAQGLAGASPSQVAALGMVLGRTLSPDLRARYQALDVRARAEAQRDAVAEAVSAAARRTPRLVIVEDLHWCPIDELWLVAGLVRAANAAPVSVLLTARPDAELLGPEGPWSVATRGVAMTELRLAPLGDRDAEALAQAAGVDPAVAHAAVVRAAGNPLFLEELLASLHDGDRRLPGTIQSLVLARLDRLAPADRQAVQVASVLGTEFTLSAIRAMLGEPEFLPTSLIEREILTGSGEAVAFRHALIRDGAYAALVRDRRRELHARAAALLGAGDPLLRARHLEQAGDAGAAAAYLEAAGVELKALRLESALSSLESAARLAPPGLRAAVEQARGEVLLDLGRARVAIGAFQAAAEAAEAPTERARAAVGEAAAHRALSNFQPGLDALDRAERALAGADDTLQAWIHYHRASLFFGSAQMEASWEEAVKAQALAERVGSPELRARALSAVGDAAYATRTFAEARDAFASTVALCDAHGLTRFSVANRIMLAHCLHLLEEPGADAAIERGLADAREIRHGFGEMFARHSRSLFAQFDGHYAFAEQEIEAALALARQLGARRFEVELRTQQVELDFTLGRPALEAARVVVREAEEGGVASYIGPWAYAVLARVTDDPAERARAIAAGEALLARGSMQFNFIIFHRLAALALQHAGDPAGALRHARAGLAVLAANGALQFKEELEAMVSELEA